MRHSLRCGYVAVAASAGLLSATCRAGVVDYFEVSAGLSNSFTLDVVDPAPGQASYYGWLATDVLKNDRIFPSETPWFNDDLSALIRYETSIGFGSNGVTSDPRFSVTAEEVSDDRFDLRGSVGDTINVSADPNDTEQLSYRQVLQQRWVVLTSGPFRLDLSGSGFFQGVWRGVDSSASFTLFVRTEAGSYLETFEFEASEQDILTREGFEISTNVFDDVEIDHGAVEIVLFGEIGLEQAVLPDSDSDVSGSVVYSFDYNIDLIAVPAPGLLGLLPLILPAIRRRR